MTQRFLLLFLWLLVGRTVSFAQDVQLKGIDLYGTSQITAELVKQKFGDQIAQVVASSTKGEIAAAQALRKQVEQAIQQMGDFARVELGIVTYFRNGKEVYVTVDVVDAKDKAARLNFLPAPTKEFADPDGLLAQWEKYQNTGFDLLDKGELKTTAQRVCPALHCVFGFEHPALKEYLAVFDQGAAKHKSLLIEILKEDKNQQHRANAAFVLAHTKDATELVRVLLPSMADASSLVRNNVMRVLGEMAEKRKDAEIPLATVAQMINFPSTSDRNKALYILSGLANNPQNKKAIIAQAGPTLIKLLRLLQPNNHDFAHIILTKVSGKDFGERDYKAWEDWLKSEMKN